MGLMVYLVCMANEGADLSKTVNTARYSPFRNTQYTVDYVFNAPFPINDQYLLTYSLKYFDFECYLGFISGLFIIF